MFDFDVGKLILFGIVALAVIPPKDLPRVMRTVGQTVGKMRRMAAEFQNQFMEAMREADLESVKKEFAALEEAAKVDVSFDPAAAMRDEMTGAVHGEAEIGSSKIDLAPSEPGRLEPTSGALNAAALPLAASPAEREPEPEPEPAPRVASQSAAE